MEQKNGAVSLARLAATEAGAIAPFSVAKTVQYSPIQIVA